MNLLSKFKHTSHMEIRPLYILYILVGAVARIGSMAMSAVRPGNAIEQLVPIWPPVFQSIRQWWYRVWFAPLDRWDATLYAEILVRGYQPGEGLVQFHPLYPLSAWLLYLLGLSPIASLKLASWMASLAFLYVFYRLVEVDLPQPKAIRVVMLFLCSPFAFALFLPYSESLFLLCATAALYFARKERWWLAGLAGALATLTRQQGIFLLLPLAWELWEMYQCSLRAFIKAFSFRFKQEMSGKGYALFLIPLAYVGWILYRAVAVDDVLPDFSSFNAMIYTTLISPNASQVVTNQAFVAPWQAFAIAVQKLQTNPDIDIVTNLIGALWFLTLFVIAWPRLRTSYKLYSLIIVLVSFMYTTGDLHPYMGLLRHLALAFPVFIGLDTQLVRPESRRLVQVAGAIGLITLLLFYTLHVWVP